MTRAMRIVALVSVMLFAVAGSGCGGNSEYGKGYNSGIIDCREAKRVGGALLAQFNSGAQDMLPEALLDPALQGRSRDWLAGYKSGYRDELAK